MQKFGDKEIIIRKPAKKDLAAPRKFQKFINDLVAEDAKILGHTKKTIKEEIEWLADVLNKIKKKQAVYLMAEHNNKVAG